MISRILRPKYAFGSPPKHYNKKKSIGIFGCIRSNNECFEILRVRITPKKEIYIMPIESTEGKLDFHISYHKSGKFHWTYKQKHIEPLYGELDYKKAFEKWLKIKQVPCYCFRRGKNLNIYEIKDLLSKIKRYLPYDYDIDEVAKYIEEKNFFIFVRK